MSPTETNAPSSANLKGYRTLALNAALVIVPTVLSWAAGVNWTDYVSPNVAVAIAGAANFGLRFLTNTPVGKGA